MSSIFLWFTRIPYFAFPAGVLFFVMACRFRRRTALAWTVWLALCNIKFFVFRTLGGNALRPELPEVLIWAWEWAYIGSVILTILSIPVFLWRFRAKAWALPVLAWTISAIGLWNAVKLPTVRETELRFANLPEELDGYRIVVLTDIHCSSELRGWRTRRIVELSNAANPDLVCVLGDNEDGSLAARYADFEPISGLRARDGVWAVTGNHEYYNEPELWFPAYERLGLRFLVNECVFPRPCLALGGVNDVEVWRVKGRIPRDDPPDTAKAFAAATNGEFRVLMQHRPEGVRRNLLECGVDLQLSGHTHGGFMPGVSRLIAMVCEGFTTGTYDFGGRKMCIANGAGQTAGFMLRFFTPGEILVVVLRRGGARIGD